MDNKLKEITEYLKQKYNPDAIFLHGSRASGYARLNSDWDFIFIYKDDNDLKDFRLDVFGENIEVSVVRFPTNNLFKSFGTKLQSAKIIFDKNGLGENLLKEAGELYDKGFLWPENWPEEPMLWMKGRFYGMKDNLDNPEIFLRYFSQFYTRSINYWYMVKNKKYSKSIYIALDEIQEKDPDFRKLIFDVSRENIKNSDRIIIVEKIINNLFNNHENNNNR